MRRREGCSFTVIFVLLLLPLSARAAEAPVTGLGDLLTPERLELQLELGPGFNPGSTVPSFVASPRLALDVLPESPRMRLLVYVPLTLRFAGQTFLGTSMSATSLELGIGGRLGLRAHPVLQPYFDVSLGLSVGWVTMEVPFQGWETAWAVGPLLRFALGLAIPLDARFTLYLEPLGLGVASGTEITALVGLGYRLGGTQ